MSAADVARVKAALSDPVELCQTLGILDGATRQAGGVLIRCPKHREKTPSCSVTKGPDGTVRVKCFGCDWGADALGLVGMVLGTTAFPDTLEHAAALAGVSLQDTSETRPTVKAGGKAPHPEASRPEAPPSRDYPPLPEVLGLWNAAGRIGSDPDAGRMLVGRAIDPTVASDLGLARVLTRGIPLPAWARYRGQSWLETGHRLLLPVYDHQGELRSVRAWRVTDGDSPKRLPPSGHLTGGLVLANQRARELLQAAGLPCRVLFVEGEPDTLTWATRTREPVFGIISGGWTKEHARHIPLGSQVIIRTHHDDAGEKYARAIAETLKGRCQILRGGAGVQAA